MTDNYAQARAYHFRNPKLQAEYLRDYTRPGRTLASFALLELMRAYLLAADVTEGVLAAELLAELNGLP